MGGSRASLTPVVVAMTLGLVAFGALVPWLVQESRRPVAWDAIAAPSRRRHLHARLRAALLSARTLAVTVAPRMEPTPDQVVSQWRSAHDTARAHAVAATPAGSAARTSPSTTPPATTSTARAVNAARTVSKERAAAGEAKRANRSSITDISSGRRGGLRSHRGSGGRTKDQLYDEARRRNIKGRSKMSKAELERAVGR